MLKSHTLVPDMAFRDILYELRPVKDPAGNDVPGLHNAWISLNNPSQLNSYTTEAVKEVILAFRQASMDRSVVAVVFTAVGDQAFCTGGNTKEYAEYYAGNPQEYKQYMRLFNDMIDAILRCDKPVVIYSTTTQFAGKRVPALRVRIPQQTEPQPKTDMDALNAELAEVDPDENPTPF